PGLFPSRPRSLPPKPVSGLLRRYWIRSLNGEWIHSNPCSPIRTLPQQQPPAWLALEIFRRELAITELDWSFAPIPKSWELVARQHPYGPPPSFRPASPYSGLDHSVSTVIPVIRVPVIPRPSRFIIFGAMISRFH